MRITVTDDKELANLVHQKLKENDGYCPCKILKNSSTQCICEEFLNAPPGPCECGLYIKL